MAGKVVSLSVHTNNKARKAEHALRQELRRAARQVGDQLGGKVSGYAVVAWTNELESRAFWATTPGVMPTGCIPGHVASTIQIMMAARHSLRLLGHDPDDVAS